MELESFEIHNFRSIKHVKCILSPKITILAGKNEAGKTTILNALEALNKDWKYIETDKPQVTGLGDFKIQFKFKLDVDDLKLLGIENVNVIPTDRLIATRTTESAGLFFSGKSVDRILETFDLIITEVLDDVLDSAQKFNDVLSQHSIQPRITLPSSVSFETSLFQNLINEVININNWIVANMPQFVGVTSPSADTLTTYLQSIIKEIDNKNVFESRIESIIPRVVLFSSFNDMLPTSVDLAEFLDENLLKQNHRIVNDLINLTKLDRTKLASANEQERANIANKASRITSQQFGKHWHQNPIEISFRIDGQKVLFYISDEDKDTLLKPEQRSKGLQWYISFFLRMMAEGSEKNILLIDEPGLYLHAKAQDDVLKLLEELSDKNQIIFSTHSPYLIDASKLGRIRLITNDLENENIEIRNFNASSDLETLTPIITAIGLDITKGLSFPNKKNIIVEGVSDYYYLLGILDYLKNQINYKFPDDITLIPCVGNANISSVVSLLHGYGFDYKILLDRKGSIKTKNALIRDGVIEESIINVGSGSEDSIEDLFDKEDQKLYAITNTNQSKAITSRNFYDKITSKKEKNTLSTKTIQQFKELFDNIKKKT